MKVARRVFPLVAPLLVTAAIAWIICSSEYVKRAEGATQGTLIGTESATLQGISSLKVYELPAANVRLVHNQSKAKKKYACRDHRNRGPVLWTNVYNRCLEWKFRKAYKPSRGYVWSEWKQLMRMAGWPESANWKWWKIATCESGRRWTTGNTYYVGLVQHNPGNKGFSRKQLENPVLNLIAARWMYEQRGYQPWPRCGKR